MDTTGLVAGIKSMRPAVPARDFAQSKRFYEQLGFQLTDIAPTLCNAQLGSYSFLLQDFYVPDFANNFVMHVFVDSADDWWAAIEPLGLAEKFSVRPPIAPRLESWGLRVTYVFDPSGVLWQFSSRP